ncbi:YbaB/EbfC family nucleoid-associated protein [bacterium]|nr:YbaB/EbfC family nucleoid-associated protein [bacterium]
MGMNLMNMMKNIQNIQKRAGEMQAELANLEIQGESAGGAVKVVCNGQGKFQSIKISPDAINPENPASVDSETIEMLEDVITSAIKNAEEKASKEMETRMTKLTGGIKIPGLSFGK